MKIYILIVLCICFQFSFSQAVHTKEIPLGDTSAGPNYNFEGSFKSTLFLKDRLVVYTDGIALVGPALIVKYDKKKTSIAVPGEEHSIPVTDVKYLKVTRGAFMKGAIIGLVPGMILGGVYGYISYLRDPHKTIEDNKERRNNRAGLYCAATGVPMGLAGGLLSAVLLRKSFVINGDRKKMERVLDKYF